MHVALARYGLHRGVAWPYHQRAVDARTYEWPHPQLVPAAAALGEERQAALIEVELEVSAPELASQRGRLQVRFLSDPADGGVDELVLIAHRTPQGTIDFDVLPEGPLADFLPVIRYAVLAASEGSY